MNELHGIVGVFDALGAKNFSHQEILNYIEAQKELMKVIDEKADGLADSNDLKPKKRFTFNDTIVLAWETSEDREFDTIQAFCRTVRAFIPRCLSKNLLFRGAFSIGSYFCDDDNNLIMGRAVTDAVSWYEQQECIGVVATPKASLIIERHVASDSKATEFLIFKTKVPTKSGEHELYAVNWPKAFYVKGLRPKGCNKDGEEDCLLRLLSKNEIPLGTEKKYANTIQFFKSAPKQGKGSG